MQITDSATDAALVAHALSAAGYDVKAQIVPNAEQLRAALDEKAWQLVIAHNQPEPLSPDKVLALLHLAAPDLPCIVVSNQLGLEAVELLKMGACDFVLHNDPAKLIAAVASALHVPEQRAAQRRAEAALRESEKKFSRAFHISPDSININRLEDGVYIDINEGFSKILGYTREEVLGRSSLPGGLGIWVNKSDRERMVAGLKTAGEVVGLEAPFRAKDGRTFIGLLSAKVLNINGEECALSFTRDITGRKQAEDGRLATIRLLRICNQAAELKDLAQELTRFLKELSDCEAVGIRLRDGPDYPYYETSGLSNDFVKAENHLCCFRPDGEPICDPTGKPVLACMCGTVLQGRTEPNQSFFTQRGSFWTNSTTALLAGTAITDPPKGTRNRCHSEGYESVALIPLRSRHGTVGLLQLNDRQKNRFSAEKIEQFEALADYVTVAVEKLLSEQALRSSEEHLREVLETTEAGYFFIDPAGRFQKVNSAWLQLHGYDRADEVIGKHFSLTQTETDLKGAMEIVETILGGAHVATAEFSRKRKDGSIGYHTFSTHLVKEGPKVVGIEGFLIDTTVLRTSREQYSMLFEQMLDGFALHEIIFDPMGNPVDYRFIAVNPAYEQMTGLKAKNLIGHTVREVLPTIEERWIKTFGDVERTGQPKRFDDYTHELDKHFDVLAFRPQAGQFACVVRDITTRKQLELQLLHSQKMDAIGQLAGGVAHDFNNILAAIMMHLNLLQCTPGLGADIKDSLKELEDEAKRAASLTRQLLVFSRRQVMQIATTDLNDLLTNLLKMLRRLIGEHIKLVFTSEALPLWIDADAGMIDQVVMNLCVNARDAMPQGGRLTIETSLMTLSATETLGDVENRSGTFVCLSVNDTGSGMDEATLKRIFEPFFTTKEPGKGTGLASPPSTASSSNTRAGSTCRASSDKARPSGFSCPPAWNQNLRPATNRPPRSKAAPKASSWSKTITVSETWSS
ncbi:MAG: PAS domain S-box protein [Verrucomicrobia bacterium]|nr:PAS domain S-box protein [Verrucomicrobiota bacterium]